MTRAVPVILSDGGAVFQPCSWRAVMIVCIYIHKERELDDVKHYPANHYVLIDDELHHPGRGEENLG